MHRMTYGETFLCIDRQMPIHGSFCLHYQTPEYHTEPRFDISQVKASKEERKYVEYDASWMYDDDSDVL